MEGLVNFNFHLPSFRGGGGTESTSRAIEVGKQLVQKTKPKEGVPKPCDHLGKLIQVLVRLLERIETNHALPRSGTCLEKLELLAEWMGKADDLVARTCHLKWFYCLVRGHSICNELKGVCAKLSLIISELRPMINHSNAKLVESLKHDMEKLERKLSATKFRIHMDVEKLYEDSQKIVTKMYNKRLDPHEGRMRLSKLLESVLGQRLRETDLGEAPLLLHKDMNTARLNKEDMEGHYISQFLALTTPKAAPPEFQCPISLGIMEEPVVLIETGVTYDKKSIVKWFEEYGYSSCPVSGKELSNRGFVEVRALKSLIQEWQRTAAQEEVSPSCLKEKELTPRMKKSGANLEKGSVVDIWDAPTSDANYLSEFDVLSLKAAVEKSQQQPFLMPENNVVEERGGRTSATGLVSAGLGMFYSFVRPSPQQEESEKESEKEEKVEVKEEESKPIDGKTGAASSQEISPAPAPSASLESGDVDFDSRQRMTEEEYDQIRSAVVNNDLRQIRRMMEDGWPMDKPHKATDGRTPLHYAAEAGHIDMVKFLLSKGANIDAKTKTKFETPLFFAASGGFGDIVKYLLQRKAKLMIVNKVNWTPLHAAAFKGHTEALQHCLESAKRSGLRTIADVATMSGWTTLHYAAHSGNVATMKVAVNFAPSVGAISRQCSEGYSPLHIAVTKMAKGSVRVLLDASADVNSQSKGGWTPLHLAQESNNVEIGLMLLENGADPNLTIHKDGLTPLHRAAFQNHIAFTELLLKDSRTNAYKLTQSGKEDLTAGRTAADIAASEHNMRLYQLLKKMGKRSWGLKLKSSRQRQR